MVRDQDHDKPAPSAETVRLAASPEDAGARLDKWLSDRIETMTRTRLKALIESGAVTRDGALETDPSVKLRPGETVEIKIPPPAAPDPVGEAIDLDIRHEDADLIVINKPAGLVVHPAAGNRTGTLVNALIAHCGDSLSGIGGVARPGIVHRLDKDTSGLLVVAKNDRAHQHLAALFSEHDIERVYEAIVVGAPRPFAGTIDAPVARARDRRRMAIVDTEDEREDARRAVTHYRVTAAYGRSRARLAGDALAAHVECRLETGRTHQIRAHLAHIGTPLIGDPLYGRGPGLAGLRPGDPAADAALAVLKGFRRQALHARILGFSHPTTGAGMRFEAEPPADFAALVRALSAL